MSDPGQPDPVVRGTVVGGPDTDWRTRAHPEADGPEWRVWSWTSGGARGGRTPAMWLGGLLIALGAAFLVQQLVPDLSLLSLLMLAAGLAFGTAWLGRGILGATVPALVLTAWALGRLVTEVGPLAGSGWVPLLVGLALLAAWALAGSQGTRRQWALWIGGLLAIAGAIDVLDLLPGVLDAEILIGLAIMALGVAVIIRRPRATA